MYFCKAPSSLFETAEKSRRSLNKWGLRGTFDPKSVLISPQERGKLCEENTFSALSFRSFVMLFLKCHKLLSWDI